MAGTLYVCGTPIGNLEDLTARVGRILGEVALVAAEDTRHTRKLLNHLGVNVRLTSYHEHNKTTKGRELIDLLLGGSDVALVSDAGMPGISDPGHELIQSCIEAAVPVVPVPGPTAFVTGLVLSGLPTDRFYYGGFLPRTPKEIREILRPLASLDATLVFYESPHRVAKSLQVVLETLGDRQAVLCRELTKLFEEAIRGRISEILVRLEETPARGELTVVVGPPEEAGPGSVEAQGAEAVALDLPGFLKGRLESGMSDKDAVKAAVGHFGIPKKEAYRAALELKRQLEACPGLD